MKQQGLKRLCLGLLFSALAAHAMPAAAGERESLEQLRATTLNLIELLVQEGILSKDKAQTLIQQAQAAKTPAQLSEAEQLAEAPAEADNTVRVQYVPEFVKNQLRDEIRQEVMTDLNYKAGVRLGLPSWLDRISFDGDLRLRYERDNFPLGNAPPLFLKGSVVRNVNIDNSSEDRDRFRLRARLGANIKVTDWLTGGIGLTTGRIDDPVSPNQTLNTRDGKFSFALDRAFLKATPYDWLSVVGGRFANPFFSTDLVWDPDLAFDGFAASFNPQINKSFSAFGTLGAFPLEEVQTSDTNKVKSKWLYGGQAGLQWKSANDSSIKFGAAFYSYDNVEGIANTPFNPSVFNGSVPAFRQKGNNTFDIRKNDAASCGFGTDNSGCGLASKFQELNLTGQIDLATFNPLHVILTGDYVKNFGFDRKEILARTGNSYKDETQGYQLRLAVGTPTVLKRHDWQIFGAYKRIEADAVLDAFTDSDFHLGGTDTKGWIAGASYGLDPNTWVTARWFSADQISGLPLSIDVLLVDLNARF